MHDAATVGRIEPVRDLGTVVGDLLRSYCGVLHHAFTHVPGGLVSKSASIEQPGLCEPGADHRDADILRSQFLIECLGE